MQPDKTITLLSCGACGKPLGLLGVVAISCQDHPDVIDTRTTYVAEDERLRKAAQLAVDTFTDNYADSFNKRCAVEGLEAALTGQEKA